MSDISDAARKCAEEIVEDMPFKESTPGQFKAHMMPFIQRACIAYHEAKSKELVKWMLQAEADHHGCFTGDCPHDKTSLCVDVLLNDFKIDAARKEHEL